MRHRSRLPALLLVLFAAPAALAAQKLETGTWTGTLMPPGEEAHAVTFLVRTSGDTTFITLRADPIGDLPFENIKVLADRITFSFSPGVVVNCILMRRDDGSYKGVCTDSDGGTGVIEMIPPAKMPGGGWG